MKEPSPHSDISPCPTQCSPHAEVSRLEMTREVHVAGRAMSFQWEVIVITLNTETLRNLDSTCMDSFWQLKKDSLYYSNHLNTWLVCYSIVDLCPVVKWSGFQMGVWKLDWKNPIYRPKCSGIRMVSKVTWLNHLNTGLPNCQVFRLIWYSGVWYSDGKCIFIKIICFRSNQENTETSSVPR